MINFLGLMGYSIGDTREVFTLEEFIETFDITKVSLGGPVFDLQKLGWLNNMYMRQKDIAELTKMAAPYYVEAGFLKSEDLSEDEFESLKKVVEIAREPAVTLRDLPRQSEIFFKDEFELPVATEDMNKKDRKSVERLFSAIEDEVGKKAIKLFKNKIEALSEKITESEAKETLNSVMEEIGEGPGKVLMPLRVVVTGQARGADLYNVISVIGRDRTLKRIKQTVEKYNIFKMRPRGLIFIF